MNVGHWPAAVLVGALCASTHAADVFVKPKAGDPSELQRARFEKYLAVRINEYRHVCDLTDKQIKKLEVAKKGAIEEAMQSFAKRLGGNQVQLLGRQFHVEAFAAPAVQQAVEVELVVEHPVAEAIVDEIDEADAGGDLDPLPAAQVDPPPVRPVAAPQFEAPQVPAAAVQAAVGIALPAPPQVFQQRMMIHPNGFGDPADVTKTVVWRTTIQRVLTPPQTKAYDLAQERRSEHRRQTHVERALIAIDTQLFLTGEQRDKLREHLLKTAPRNFDRVVPPNAAMSDAIIAAQISQQIPKESLEGILDPVQIDRWDEMQHQQNGNIVFFGGFNR